MDYLILRSTLTGRHHVHVFQLDLFLLSHGSSTSEHLNVDMHFSSFLSDIPRKPLPLIASPYATQSFNVPVMLHAPHFLDFNAFRGRNVFDVFSLRARRRHLLQLPHNHWVVRSEMPHLARLARPRKQPRTLPVAALFTIDSCRPDRGQYQPLKWS